MTNLITLATQDDIIKYRLLDEIDTTLGKISEYVVSLGGSLNIVPKSNGYGHEHKCYFQLKNRNATMFIVFKILHDMRSNYGSTQMMLDTCTWTYEEYKVKSERVYSKAFTEVYVSNWPTSPLTDESYAGIGEIIAGWSKTGARILTREMNAVEYKANTPKEIQEQDRQKKHKKKIESKTEAIDMLKDQVFQDMNLTDHDKREAIFKVANTILTTENAVGLHEINKTNIARFKEHFVRVVKILKPLYA